MIKLYYATGRPSPGRWRRLWARLLAGGLAGTALGILPGNALALDESLNLPLAQEVDQSWREAPPEPTPTARGAEVPAEQVSIHQMQQAAWDAMGLASEADFDVARRAALPAARPLRRAVTRTGTLSKRVVGWHPYWMGTAYANYDFSVLSTIAFFSYEVNPATGGYTSLHGWDTTPLIAWGHSNGVKVVLTATCFGGTGTKQLLTNAAASQALINNLVSVVSNRGGDGVNIDFEGISDSALKATLTAFMSNLTTRFHRDIPGSEVSLALPAVDWYNVFDVGAYDAFLDYGIIMGYDYYYRGSSTAGPVSPLDSSTRWGSYSCTDSVESYLARGLGADKLLLGLPYYGYDWPTTACTIPSTTTASGSAVLYASCVANAATYGRRWDASGSVPYYWYTSSAPHQCFYDDAESLGLKYDMVTSKGIGGVGIWALGYDDTRPELWNLLAEKFLATSSPWTRQAPGVSGNLYGVGFGANQFVAVGASGVILTSASGSSWASRTSGTTALLLNAGYGDSLYVAVGENGTILTSPDAATWTARAAGTNAMLRGIAYGSGLHAAVGNDGAIVTSPDGAAWTPQVSGTSQGLQGVLYAQDQFVAVGAGGVILTSPDGAAWTAQTSGTTSWLLGAAFGQNTYVAVGLGGVILTSTNGMAWTARTSGTSAHLYRVAYGTNKFVAVGTSGTVLSSTNGAAWSAETSGVTNFLRGVAYGNGLFCAAGYEGTIITSGDQDPVLTLTTLGTTVPYATTNLAVAGTANDRVTGQIRWTNSLGGGGSVAAATNWTINAAPLAVGANVITVTGTNASGAAASQQVTITRPAGGETQSAGTDTIHRQAGALDNIIIYTCAGHGWTASGSSWITQRGLLFGMVEDMGNVDQMNYFVNYCFRAGATIVPFRPLGYQTNEVVLDNDSAGVSFTGTWYNSSSTIFYGSAGDTPYKYAYVSTNSQTVGARYVPTIPSAGFYPVYCWTRSGSDRVRQVYRIRHSGGLDEVRVNHRRVGLGWVWLGNYYFEQGTNGYVDISNYAPGYNVGSDVIIADAIRFGNGKGDINRGYGVSGYERELECARYWVQNAVDNAQGMSSALYDLSGYSDSDDNVGTPSRTAGEMNRSEDGTFWDRLYLGFHSNASGTSPSTARGAMGLYDNRGTAEKQGLQKNFGNAVNGEIEIDMEYGDGGVLFSDDWTDNSADMYGSAYGELYNTSMNAEMVSTIIEVAFHDNDLDCYLLKDPGARDVLGRACYQAIVKYLNTSNALVPLALAPDMPGNVRACNSGVGQVTVAWDAPATNAAGGHAASGYVVYRSANGYGFGNPVTVGGAGSTAVTLTNLAAGETWYFQVAATNAGGESMPSATVGVRVSPMGRAYHLFVNGYDRNTRSLSPVRYFGSNVGGDTTLVRPRQINSFDYVVQHGEALAAAGRYFDACHHAAVEGDDLDLGSYHAVYWNSGQQGYNVEAFPDAAKTRIADFLNAGGRLLVSGAEWAWDLESYRGAADDIAFLHDVLRADFVNDSSGLYSVNGRSSSIFSGISSVEYDNGTGTTYRVKWPDVITNINSSAVNMIYGSTSAYGAGLQYSNVCRLVCLGFPFESILDAADRSAVMARILTFFGDAAAELPAVVITNQDVTVAAGTTVFTVGGTNNAAVTGHLQWTNRLTGGAGLLAAASTWRTNVTVAMGTNAITVRGSNYLGTAWASDTVTVVVAGSAVGALAMTLGPQEAVDAGALWRVDSGAWRASGYTESGLVPGIHTATFATVAGWTAPASQAVSISNGQTTAASAAYAVVAATGAVMATLGPPEAVTAGAQWQIDGGTWLDSGYTQGGVATGTHVVAFKVVSGWDTPAVATVEVVQAQTALTGGNYTRQEGALTVIISPPSAVDAGAQWNVDSGAWQAGDAIVNNLAAGVHTVRFSSVSGWLAPGTQTVAIADGALATLEGGYVQQLGALTVEIEPAAARTAGALWNVDGGAWRASGEIAEELGVEPHSIGFQAVSGWSAPGAKSASVVNGQTTTVYGTYSQLSAVNGEDNAQWVAEGPPADGDHVSLGGEFTKSWTFQNTGATTWRQSGGYKLQHYWEHDFGVAEFSEMDAAASIAPGQTNTWTLTLTAPTMPGTYRGYWMMYCNGRFGDPVWVEIIVDPPPNN